MSFSFFSSLFYVSFLPLWLSVLFIDVLNIYRTKSYHITECLSCAVIILTTFYCVIDIKRSLHNVANDRGKVNKALTGVKVEKTITSEFLLMYILPLFAFRFTQWDGVVLFLLYFCMLCYLHTKNKIFCMSLLLEIFDYKVFECKLVDCNTSAAGEEIKLVLSRRELRNELGETIPLGRINNDYYLDIRSR